MAKRRTRTPEYETYIASSKPAARKPGAAAAAARSAFKIEVRFIGGLNAAQKKAFKAAADRWANVIVGDLPSVRVDGEVIDDLLILAQGTGIDGRGGILGQAGPTHIRPKAAGKFKFLPVKGVMSFDTADLKDMQKDGTLQDVITHEMGHVVGVGTMWERKGLLKDAGRNTVRFIGKNARREYGKLIKKKAADVPVENTGGAGTAGGHWRESVFRNELMSGFIVARNNPLSRVTVASLLDMGYEVDLSKAEPYKLPDVASVAAAGATTTHDQPHALPVIPIEVPDSSLVP
jgi:hypothetical protein